MIASFYDKNFVGVDNNASLKIDKNSYKLIKRPIEMNELSCTCEAFSQNIQPTFLVIRDENGRYVYGSLAGVPTTNSENKTEINGTDLRSMLSSDIFIDFTQYSPNFNFIQYVDYVIGYFFMLWDKQVNQESFNCELVYKEVDPYTHEITTRTIYKTGDEYVDPSEDKSVTDYKLEDYKTGIYNSYEEIQKFMRFYDMYMDTHIDIVNNKIQFIFARSMLEPVNIKLWEYGIKNYGKIITDINETQGYVVKTEKNQQDEDVEVWYTQNYDSVPSTCWILTSNGDITINPVNRDIYPIKRKLISSTEDMIDANRLALEELLNFKYIEDIDLNTERIKPSMNTRFIVYVNRGDNEPYKELPCGELQYDANNELVRFKIGYRYTTVNFI